MLGRLGRIRTTYSSGASSDIGVYLVRSELDTNTAGYLVGQIVPNSSGTRTTVTHTPSSTLSVVDNSRYAYGFGVCLGATTIFEGARITYQYTRAGD